MAYVKKHMEEALSLAAKANPSPNPRVGCVIVKRGSVIGSGYHRGFGKPHAEREALADANRKGNSVRGADMYVTLEPCDHQGKTPPCTDAIIASDIKGVYVGMKDPHRIVRGKGMAKLRKHGISVEMDMMVKESRSLNPEYLKNVEQGMPFVAMKVGVSLDGRIATKKGDSKWITNDLSRKHAHRLRSQHQGIITGINTVLKDDPRLNVRDVKGWSPVPIILDSRLRIPLKSKVLKGRQRAVVATVSQDERRILQVAKIADVMVVKEKKGRIDLNDLMKNLYAVGFHSVMVEAGGEVVGSFIDGKLIDHAYFFIAPKIIGGREAKPSVAGEGIAMMKDAMHLEAIKQRRFGDDILIEGRVIY